MLLGWVNLVRPVAALGYERVMSDNEVCFILSYGTIAIMRSH